MALFLGYFADSVKTEARRAAISWLRRFYIKSAHHPPNVDAMLLEVRSPGHGEWPHLIAKFSNLSIAWNHRCWKGILKLTAASKCITMSFKAMRDGSCDFIRQEPNEGHERSRDVIWGHQQFLADNSWWKRDTGFRKVPMSSSRREESTDMQYDMFWSGHEFDLRSRSWLWPGRPGVKIISPFCLE
jgi:hypothetical protein